MKYNTTLRKFYLQPVLLKKISLTFVAIIVLLSSYATNYTSNGTGNWNAAGSWTPAGIPGAGDNVTINAGNTITLNFNNQSVGTITLSAGSGLTFNSSSLTVGGSWINNGATISYNCACNSNTVIMTGAAGSIGGSSATTLDYLTINTGGTVSLATSGLTIANSGILYLTSGAFNVGTGNIIKMGTNGGTTIDGTGGGSFATTGVNGSDGGTIEMMAGSGNTLTVLGSPTFYNIISGNGGDANWHLALSNAGVRINGTLSATDLVGSTIPNSNQWSVNGPNAPIYGPASTLIVNSNNQQYSPGSANVHYEWLSIAPGSGTIGTTPGYPNNVIIANVSNSASNYNGKQYGVKLSGNWSINGTFQVGTPTIPALIDLDNGGAGTNNFSSGGITIEPNSMLAGPGSPGVFNVNGNWSQDATATYISNNGTITFGGAGTDNISMSSGTETSFNSVTINANVNLNSPVTLSGLGVLTLTSGIVTTTAANPLTVTNTSTTAITSASAATYVNGPLAWTMAATTTNNYVFPVGGSGEYLPLTLSPNSTSSEIATVQAFGTGAPGTPDGTTVTSLSTTEYWSVSTSAPFTTGASVSVTRSGAVVGYNALAKSTTAGGVYSAIGGAAAGNTISNASLGTTSPWFLSMVMAPLSVQAVSSTNVSCSGGSTIAGSLTVQGSGGTQPYQYQLDGGGYFPAVPTSGSYQFTGLSQGTHTAFVKDNLGNTAGPVTVTVLGSLQINNNNDTTICSGASVPMTAYNLQSGGAAPAATYSWTSIPAGFVSAAQSISPSPVVTTQYVVSSQLYTNLLTNPGFEAGASGFSTDYSFSTTSPYGAAPGGHGGLYYVCAASNQMCTGFNVPIYTPHGGGEMLVCDGPINGTGGSPLGAAGTPTPPGNPNPTGTRVWYETVPVTAGTNYTFSYYYGYADNNNDNQLQTTINGALAVGGANPVTMVAPWSQVTYTWNSGASTTATIALYDVGPECNQDIGNDFMLDDMAFYSPCTVTDTMKVTVVGVSLPGTVSASQNVCSGSTPAAAITLAGNTGAIVSWQSANNAGFAGATTIANTTTSLTPAQMGPITVNTYFRAVVQSCPTNVFSTPALMTVVPLPTITLSATAPACFSAAAQTVNLPYTATTGAPTTYSINGWSGGGFANVVAAALPATPIIITVPAGVATGTYTANLTVSNAGGCVSAVYPISVTITAAPTITLSAIAPVCFSAAVQTVNLPYTATTGAPTTYSINGWSGGGFANVVAAALPATPIVITVPAGVAGGAYTANLTVNNGSCTSVVYPITVTINALPTITLSAIPATCFSAAVQTVNLPYTATTGAPTTYSINGWSGGGFANVVNAALPATPIVITVPAGVAGGAYTANLTVSNGTCTSIVYPITVTINALPTITLSAIAPTCFSAAVQTVNLPYTATTGAPTTYSINGWSGGGFANVVNAALPATPIVITVPAGVAAGAYTASLTVKNANGCVSSVSTITVTITALPTITLSAIAPTCFSAAVQTVNLPYTATTGAPTTYSINGWSGGGFANVVAAALPATPIVITVPAGVAGGAYTANLTVNNGTCTSIVYSITVTINALPTITLSAIAPTCFSAAVQTVNLPYTATTGAPTTYSINGWSGGGFANVVNAAIPATPIVINVPAGAAAGAYTASLTVKNANGCVSSVSTITVTITALPTITLSAIAPTCFSAAVQTVNLPYTATTGAPTTYSINGWSGGGFANVVNAALPATPIVITVPAGVANGAYTANLTVNNGTCTSIVYGITVTINALPTITGTLNACVGATTNLTGSGVPAAVNPWVSATTAVATVTNAGVVTGVSAGTSVITYTNNNGCSISATVTINATPTITGAASVVVGGTDPLTGSGAPAAVNPWVSSTPAVATVSNVGVVTGVSNGTTVITYTNSNGCTVTTTITVSNVPTISGPADVCLGSSITLVGSGIPAAVNPYVSSAPGVATITNGGVLSTVTTGTTTITYTDNSGNTATQVETVNPLPTITGTLTACVGNTTTLTGSGVPAAVNPWVSATPAVATVTNAGVVTGVSAGTSVITYTNNNGCLITATVTINANPTITGTLTACVGNTTTLIGSGVPAAVNPWVSATPAVATVNNTGVVTAVSAGTSVITYTNNNGCLITATVTISANPTITGTLTACVGNTTTLIGSGVPAAVNPWVSATPAVATVNNTGVVTAVSAGTSVITYTNNNGCLITAPVTTPVLVTVATPGVADTHGVTAAGTPEPVHVVLFPVVTLAAPVIVGAAFTVNVAVIEQPLLFV